LRRKESETGSLPTPWLLRLEFDDLVERFFGEEPMVFGRFGRIFSPPVNIAENENEITVTAEIPGMDKSDLDVSLSGEVLTINGKKKIDHEEKTENFHRVERSYGSYSRSFTLPCEVRQDQINANFNNGILTLKLPKSERCKKKSVKIDLH